MTETLWTYQSAIRWGRYADALEFQKDPQKNYDYLSVRNVKVTSYQVERKAFSEDGDRLHQTVEIRYIREPGIVEKTIFDKQDWFYDEETGGAGLWKGNCRISNDRKFLHKSRSVRKKCCKTIAY